MSPACQPPTATGNGQHDFDFEFGRWTAKLSRRLRPLTGSNEWVAFEGSSVVHPLWQGRANVGELDVTGPAGRIEGLTLRLYDPATRRWTIRFANSRDGELTPGLVGGFTAGQGEFHDQETLDGGPSASASSSPSSPGRPSASSRRSRPTRVGPGR